MEKALDQRHPSDSSAQGKAEKAMIDILNQRLGTALGPKRLALPDGVVVDLDGYDKGKFTLCEVFAHLGGMKPGQRRKVASDILKLVFTAAALGGSWRKVLCIAAADTKGSVARALEGNRSWLVTAIKCFGIEVEVVVLPQDVALEIRKAQSKQIMRNSCD